jgi:4-amino-4-deoxy-L-arabinose transferase-like glycosyltransferase
MKIICIISKLIDKHRRFLIVLCILFVLGLGFFLRHDDYRIFPRHGATFDEFAWTWLGINLIQHHEPISWSSQPQYTTKKHLVYQGAAFWIVKPYLEHPPLFGLVAGSFALANGVKDMYDVTLAKIRPLALLVGTISILLVFLLTKQLYGTGAGLLASLLYATIPTLVIGSRIVQNENFLIPSWLLSLYLLFRYLKKKKRMFFWGAAIIAGLLSLAKVPWLVVGLSLCMLLSYKGRWKDAFLTGGIVLGIFSLFIIYGFYWDKELFINLWRLQTARYDISFFGFFSLFTKPLLVDRYYLDGWILFGWFSVLLLSKEFKKYFYILIPFIAYLVLYIFAIPDEASHGWYRYPFYPFLIIASALVLKEEYIKPTLVSLFFLLLVGLTSIGNTWETSYGFSFLPYRAFILTAAASILIPQWFPKLKKFSKPIFILWLVFFIFLNAISVMIFTDY